MTTYNQTKIICTLGPASDTYEMMKALYIVHNNNILHLDIKPDNYIYNNKI